MFLQSFMHQNSYIVTRYVYSGKPQNPKTNWLSEERNNKIKKNHFTPLNK